MKEIDIFIKELETVCWTEIDKFEVIDRLREIKQVVSKQFIEQRIKDNGLDCKDLDNDCV